MLNRKTITFNNRTRRISLMRNVNVDHASNLWISFDYGKQGRISECILCSRSFEDLRYLLYVLNKKNIVWSETYEKTPERDTVYNQEN